MANYNVSAKMQGVSILLFIVTNKKSFVEKNITQRKVGSWLDQYINSHENKDLNETRMTFQEK